MKIKLEPTEELEVLSNENGTVTFKVLKESGNQAVMFAEFKQHINCLVAFHENPEYKLSAYQIYCEYNKHVQSDNWWIFDAHTFGEMLKRIMTAQYGDIFYYVDDDSATELVKQRYQHVVFK